MERMINMSGKATVTAPSDITVVSFDVTGRAKEYSKAVQEMTDCTVRLKDAIEKSGIAREALKTTNLSVSQAYSKRKIGVDEDGDDVYKEYPDGFVYEQGLSFEFPNDNKKLADVLGRIMKMDITPRIRFSFRNSDMEALKNRALQEACRHAKDEAETIVQSVGAKLGKLLSVDRKFSSYGGYEDYSDCKMLASPIYDGGFGLDIDPEDTSVEESVTMVWEIED